MLVDDPADLSLSPIAKQADQPSARLAWDIGLTRPMYGLLAAVLAPARRSGDPAARYDRYDPNVDVAHDQYARWNVAAHWFYQGLTRFTLAYEIPRTDRADGAGGWTDPKDNLWTLQFQHAF